MLEGLLKHEKLGNKDELLLFLFDGISERNQTVSGLKNYCTTQLFSIGRSFNGIMALCRFVGFVRQNDDDTIIVNQEVFRQSEHFKKDYFENDHFFQRLMFAFTDHEVIHEMFNEDNLKFNSQLNRYYVVDNKFSYKYLIFRNLLLSTGFFERDEEVINHLLIKVQFNPLIERFVVNEINARRTRKKITLAELRNRLKRNDDAGLEAEEFVLQHERSRLNGHPVLHKVIMISDDDVGAGYDIESFNDRDSVIIDRFIEVKSFSSVVSFYWSKNEVEMAKTLGRKYFLYLVDRSKIKEPGYEPKTFENPYQKVFESDLWRKETVKWQITFDD